MKHKKFWGRILAVVLSVMLVVQVALIPASALSVPSLGSLTSRTKTTTAVASAVQAQSKTETKIVLKSGASVTYSKDADTMKKNIYNSLVDTSSSTLPTGATYKDFTYEYYTTGYNNVLPHQAWYPVEGGSVKPLFVTYTASQMGAGENQKIRVSYKGSDTFSSASAEGTITVSKANVLVTVRPAIIYPEENLPSNFITTNPTDNFDIYTIYAGVTSGVTGIVYVQIPTRYTDSATMKILDGLFYVARSDHKTLSQLMNEGMTVGQLRTLLQEINTYVEKGSTVLDALGIDTSALTKITKVVDNLPGIMDSVRVAFGKPSRAGTYLVTAVTSSPNYNTGVGVGVLHVKMHVSNVKMAWNTTLSGSVSAANAANTDFGATLSYNSAKADDQSGIQYCYAGMTSANKAYHSKTAPTEAGTYVETAYVFGGNYLASPLVRTITIA